MSYLGEFLYLSRSDVGELNIPMKEVIKVVERAFQQRAEGKAEVPPKPGFTLEKIPSSMPCLLICRR
jgi:ornithine cyclodeaminase/alanine dehydrogenase-like protein (mu-crystallin family)